MHLFFLVFLLTSGAFALNGGLRRRGVRPPSSGSWKLPATHYRFGHLVGFQFRGVSGLTQFELGLQISTAESIAATAAGNFAGRTAADSFDAD
jgi:hypothetical protein